MKGMSIDTIYELTSIDPWFLYQIKQIVDFEKEIESKKPELTGKFLTKAKSLGFSDVQLAHLLGSTEDQIKSLRNRYDVRPVYKLVDTCAGEFKAATPYYYSTYEMECG